MAGIKFTSRPGDRELRRLVLRESQYAANNFGIKGEGAFNYKVSSIIPKPKFLFFAKIVLNEDLINSAATSGLRPNDPNEGIIFQVKTIDKPKFNAKTETLHQYNKKRVIQTKVDFQPMTIAFHDDVADKVLSFWSSYYSYYYGDGWQSDVQNWSWDIYNNEFNEGSGGGWGYTTKHFGGRNTSDVAQYISSIDLYQFYGGYYNVIRFVRPKITVFDHDANDYADGREGTSIRMTFDYEGVIYNIGKSNEEKITNNGITTDNAQQFRFLSDYYETPVSAEDGIIAQRARSFADAIMEGINDARQNMQNPPKSGRNQLLDALASAIPVIPAGSTALDGTGFTFGTGALVQYPGSVIDMVTLTSLSGQIPSPDLIEKASGVKTVIDNFGSYISPSTGQVLVGASNNPNNGIDSLKVNQAAAILNPGNLNGEAIEEVIGDGVSRILDRTTANEFSRALGTAAAIAKNEGIITSVANYTNEIHDADFESKSLVNKVPNGNYQLTEIGSAVLNSVRAPDSFVGSRRPPSNVTADPSDINKKALLLEENRKNLV